MSKKTTSTIRTLTLSAMLVALSVLFSSYAKAIPDTFLRFSFENLPILFGAVLFGPLQGGAIGCAADIISCTLIGGYAPNPILTVGIVSVGVVAGLISRIAGKKRFTAPVLLLSVFSAHVIGNMLIKSFGLYYMGLLPSLIFIPLQRVPLYLVIGALEYTALLLLFKNKTIRSLAIGRMK
ncbi:MAG: folate family ECF transporter S component [Ruminococcaceae bacterium]|nr:folate family ECF transporter S component [Oscillospiraceae bacterium]